MAMRPCGAVISPRSCKIFNTMAVLLSEKRNPRNTASFQDRPAKRDSRAVTPIVPKTCIAPPPITVFLMEARALNENSMPMTNSRKMMPISERSSTSCDILTRLRPCGPMSTPVPRNPRMLGSFNRWNISTTNTDMPRMMTTSARIGISMRAKIVA